ncbi:MAG: protein kinase, partial [Planctomycetota bacterium]
MSETLESILKRHEELERDGQNVSLDHFLEEQTGGDGELATRVRIAIHERESRERDKRQKSELSNSGSRIRVGSEYQVEKEASEGATGFVFRARDTDLERSLAIKVLKSSLTTNAERSQRFSHEAEITSQLDHPGVVPVYGRGKIEGGAPFYAMRFVDGETLDERIRQFHNRSWPSQAERRRRLHDIIRHIVQAAYTIDYAHERGVLNCEIKPCGLTPIEHDRFAILTHY